MQYLLRQYAAVHGGCASDEFIPLGSNSRNGPEVVLFLGQA
jgi:hypothetical protein